MNWWADGFVWCWRFALPFKLCCPGCLDLLMLIVKYDSCSLALHLAVLSTRPPTKRWPTYEYALFVLVLLLSRWEERSSHFDGGIIWTDHSKYLWESTSVYEEIWRVLTQLEINFSHAIKKGFWRCSAVTWAWSDGWWMKLMRRQSFNHDGTIDSLPFYCHIWLRRILV